MTAAARMSMYSLGMGAPAVVTNFFGSASRKWGTTAQIFGGT